MNFLAFLITRNIESHFKFATHFAISFHQAHDIDFSVFLTVIIKFIICMSIVKK